MGDDMAMFGLSQLGEDCIIQDLGKDRIIVHIDFQKAMLLQALGLHLQGDRELLRVDELDNGRVRVVIEGRFPVWARHWDSIDYVGPATWHEMAVDQATLIPGEDMKGGVKYVEELQAALMAAQREVDERWRDTGGV
jgi:hypothetical protein